MWINLQKEVIILCKLENIPEVISLKQLVINRKFVILITEYNHSHNLKYFINNNKLSKTTIKNIFKKIVDVIMKCHAKMIVHRDIKLENILIDQFLDIKLIDFGYSEILHSDKLCAKFISCGTLNYIAPEVLFKSKFNRKYLEYYIFRDSILT